MKTFKLQIALALALVASLGMTSRAAQRGGRGNTPAVAPTSPSGSPDISGFWTLTFDSRKVPPADLAPGVTKAMIEAHAKADAHATRWCNLLGTPFVMDPGEPIDIRQGNSEVIVNAETSATPRHLYFRPKHTDPNIFDPSTNGDSIAHWEGDTLVVDTVGFADKKGLSAIPGGGFRTGTSHLLERYRMIEGGKVLSVTFTWTDPKIFRTPHTYEFRYYRMPSQYEPTIPIVCDPYDDVRSKFLDDAASIKAATPPATKPAGPAQ